MNVSEEVIDGIRELVTIGVGRSAGMLNRLTKAHVTLTVPEVQISNVTQDIQLIKPTANSINSEEISHIILEFSGELTGSFDLIIPFLSALNLVMLLTGEKELSDEMDALRVETLLEVSNIIISSVMSSLSIFLKSRLLFQFPRYQVGKAKSIIPYAITGTLIGIIAHTHFLVQDRHVESDIFITLTPESFQYLKIHIEQAMENGL